MFQTISQAIQTNHEKAEAYDALLCFLHEDVSVSAPQLNAVYKVMQYALIREPSFVAPQIFAGFVKNMSMTLATECCLYCWEHGILKANLEFVCPVHINVAHSRHNESPGASITQTQKPRIQNRPLKIESCSLCNEEHYFLLKDLLVSFEVNRDLCWDYKLPKGIPCDIIVCED